MVIFTEAEVPSVIAPTPTFTVSNEANRTELRRRATTQIRVTAPPFVQRESKGTTKNALSAGKRVVSGPSSGTSRAKSASTATNESTVFALQMHNEAVEPRGAMSGVNTGVHAPFPRPK